MVERMEGYEIENFINILHRVHCDNSKQQYYAERKGNRRISIMPLTPFVYEFFIFNSLYQVDWAQSYIEDDLIFHPDEFGESKQQSEFTKFIKNHAKQKPSDLYRAFEPLSFLPKAVGEWTKVTPDARITVEQGESFFNKIKEFQIVIENCNKPEDIPVTKKIFESIDKARYFIYLVRNNIFHGSKTLGEAYEPNQKKRIEIYDIFLKGLTSLFFLSVGKNAVASDFVPCSIKLSSPDYTNEEEVLDQNTVWTALNNDFMKIGDSRVISQFIKQLIPPTEKPSNRDALFYPSSGCDLLTPLLLGLPYCTQFYFFERYQKRNTHQFLSILKRIRNLKINGKQNWDKESGYQYLEFEYNTIPRKLFWVHSDNKNFLKYDVDLSFYFHRGDGSGEGGSGQKWDSELLPELFKMIVKGKDCVYFTDGIPGGIDIDIFKDNFILYQPFINTSRKYYCGNLKKGD